MIEDLVGGLLVPFLIVSLILPLKLVVKKQWPQRFVVLTLPLALYLCISSLLGWVEFPPHNFQEALVFMVLAGSVWAVGAKPIKERSLAAFLAFRFLVGVFLIFSFWTILRPIEQAQGLGSAAFYFAISALTLFSFVIYTDGAAKRIHHKWILSHHLFIFTGWAVVLLLSGSASVAQIIGGWNAALFAWLLSFLFQDKPKSDEANLAMAWASPAGVFLATYVVISHYFVEIPIIKLLLLLGAQACGVLFFLNLDKPETRMGDRLLAIPWRTLLVVFGASLGFLCATLTLFS